MKNTEREREEQEENESIALLREVLKRNSHVEKEQEEERKARERICQGERKKKRRARKVREMEKNKKRGSKKVCHVVERDGNRRRILRNDGEKRSYGGTCASQSVFIGRKASRRRKKKVG